MPSTFAAMYPLSSGLGLKPVSTPGGPEHAGFDSDDVLKAFKNNQTRFDKLMSGVKSVFCCGHRTWKNDHPNVGKRNTEVHCIWADDLEAFLKAGN